MIVEQPEQEQTKMANGIRINKEEAEYREYMNALYSKLESSEEPKVVDISRNLNVCHPWHGVPVGENAPDVVNVIIEIPALSRVKTELDKPTGLLKVDRILHSSVVYPANYGFIPGTYGDDHDPLDVLVLCQLSVPPLSLMRVRPIGIMPMVDGGEGDDKIIAVAISDPEYNIYYDVSELPPFKMLMINQFFDDYKRLERKEVKTFKPLGAGHAKRIIQESIASYRTHFKVLQ